MDPYKKQDKSVLAVLETVIQDCNHMKEDYIKSEQEAQNLYAENMIETYKTMKALKKTIVNLKGEKAELDGTIQGLKARLEASAVELDNLAKENLDLHTRCDFLLKNFDKRRTSRTTEVEALQEAISI